MKEYWIISETLKQSDFIYRMTINTFHSHITKARRDPIRTIEACGMRLYFVDERSWFTKYMYGRHDMKVVSGMQFERFLDDIRYKKKERSYETII